MKKYNDAFFFILLSSVLILSSCNANDAEQGKNGVKTEQISYTKNPYITKKVNEVNGVEDVRMVQADEKLLVAIKVTNFDRIQLMEITKKVKKRLKRQHPDQQVIVTPDKKIYLEIGRLEEKIKNDQLSEKAVAKKVNRLIKLSKDKG